jgi:hypothetical protein
MGMANGRIARPIASLEVGKALKMLSMLTVCGTSARAGSRTERSYDFLSEGEITLGKHTRENTEYEGQILTNYDRIFLCPNNGV